MRTSLRLSWLTVGFYLLLPTGTQAAQVVAEGAFLRAGPGTDQPVVVQLQRGDELHLAEKNGDWYLAETDDNHVGWVNASVLKNVEPLKPETGPAASKTPSPEAVLTPPPATTPLEASPTTATTPTLASPANAATPTVITLPAKAEPPPASTKPNPEPSPSAPELRDEEKLSRGEYRSEYREMSLAIRPAYAWTSKTVPSVPDHHGFAVGAHASFFLWKHFGLQAPYTYLRYGKNETFHSAGGGPIVRFVDLTYLRASMDGSALYVRGLGANHFGWSVGSDLTVGNRKAKMRPFIGPFFRYETYYIPGTHLSSMMVGASLTLTNLSDLD
jgi:uncharacterized protein YgiM (DUF1202 family)